MENKSLECDVTHYLNTDIVVHTAPPFSVDIYCGSTVQGDAQFNNKGVVAGRRGGYFLAVMRGDTGQSGAVRWRSVRIDSGAGRVSGRDPIK